MDPVPSARVLSNSPNFLASRPSCIITTASLKNAKYLKSIGATHVIDRSVSASTLVSVISSVTKDVRIKYAVDSICTPDTPDTQQAVYDLLTPGGQLVTFLPVPAKATQGKDILQVQGLLMHPDNRELLEAFHHDHVERLLREGTIKPNQVEVLPNGLSGIPDGLKLLETA